jgi:O-acetyl-ADP-ribose deacetylase
MSQVIAEAVLGNRTLSLRQGDLTEEPVDAVVNAANEALQHGGGLAAAIVRRGGPDIQRESDAAGWTPTGTAAITGAGALPARHVIHAVGPVWDRYEEAEAERLLASAVEAALEMADARDAKSVALPALSAGIFGFPKDRCARIVLGAIAAFLEHNPHNSLREVRVVLMDDETLAAFREEWDQRFTALSN